MSRIPAVDPANADPKAEPLLDAVAKSLGVVPNLFRVAAKSPAALEGLLGLNGALARGELDAKVRESIALAVAEANGCDYCLSAHAVLGGAAGLSGADIAAARDGRAHDPRTAAAARFARSLVESGGRATDGDLLELRRAGLGDVEIVAAVAANIFTNYLNQVADTAIDFPVVRAGMAAAA